MVQFRLILHVAKVGRALEVVCMQLVVFDIPSCKLGAGVCVQTIIILIGAEITISLYEMVHRLA